MSDTADGSSPARAPIFAQGPVAVFDSIHAVLAAERAFLSAGLACDLVPIPRDVTSDCGMALMFRAVDLEPARTLLSGPTLAGRLRGLFVSGPGGYAREAMANPTPGSPPDGAPHTGPTDPNDSHPDRRKPRP